jgi:hypothetical protein
MAPKSKPAPTEAAAEPALSMNKQLVAFIDILGFGHEIVSARSEADLRRIQQKMLFVQKEFSKSSAFDDPVDQERLNRDYGKRVIALSDAVVVAVNLRCPATETNTIDEYDLVGSALWDLIAAQGRCVCNGIFVRGGISHGPFFFENDVLLSPSLAKAYQLESRDAEFPITAITSETIAWLRSLNRRHAYAPGADPFDDYFRQHERPDLFFLDYMRVLVNEQHRGMLPKERKAYREAMRRRDYAKADEAFQRSVYKDAAFFLKHHRLRIEAAFRADRASDVRRKYHWLMRYHNSSFRMDIPYLSQQRIDLRKFRLRTGSAVSTHRGESRVNLNTTAPATSCPAANRS